MCCLDHQDPRVSVGKSTVLPWRQTRRPSGSCLGDKVRSHIQTHVSLDLRESFHPHVNCHSHVTDETFLTFRTSTGMSTSPWQMIPTLFETLSSPPSLVALKLFILIINALTSSFLYRVFNPWSHSNQSKFPNPMTPSNKVRQGVPGNRTPPANISNVYSPPGSDVDPLSLGLYYKGS